MFLQTERTGGTETELEGGTKFKSVGQLANHYNNCKNNYNASPQSTKFTSIISKHAKLGFISVWAKSLKN